MRKDQDAVYHEHRTEDKSKFGWSSAPLTSRFGHFHRSRPSACPAKSVSLSMTWCPLKASRRCRCCPCLRDQNGLAVAHTPHSSKAGKCIPLPRHLVNQTPGRARQSPRGGRVAVSSDGARHQEIRAGPWFVWTGARAVFGHVGVRCCRAVPHCGVCNEILGVAVLACRILLARNDTDTVGIVRRARGSCD